MGILNGMDRKEGVACCCGTQRRDVVPSRLDSCWSDQMIVGS
jgi:hypothetical protein